VVLILLGGIGLQAVAVSVPRAFSNDLYRYMWDGKVQAAGIDPYQYVPTATQLTGLRNEFLFHPGAQYCVSPGYVRSHPAAELTAGCTRINRPTVPTIYPPVAEAYFLAVYYLHPADDSSVPIQAAAAAVAVLVTVLLLIGLVRLGRDVLMAAPPVVHGRGRRQQRVHRRLHAACDPGRHQGGRLPARLPAAGELHHREQVRDHRPVHHRAACHRGGAAHPGRGRLRRAPVLPPR